MNKAQLRQEEGFTIIEIFIVLALAAIILLAVFTLVPNIQRNNRNNQRSSDVSTISTQVANYDALYGANSGENICGSLACNIPIAQTRILSNTNLVYYNLSNIIVTDLTTLVDNQATQKNNHCDPTVPCVQSNNFPLTDRDHVLLVIGAECGSNVASDTVYGNLPLIGKPKDVAIFYSLETADLNSDNQLCTQASFSN